MQYILALGDIIANKLDSEIKYVITSANNIQRYRLEEDAHAEIGAGLTKIRCLIVMAYQEYLGERTC